jgi:hypothetical protein
MGRPSGGGRQIARGEANCMAASVCRARGLADFDCTSLGFGAGQHRWTVFPDGIFVYGVGAA